MTVQNEHFSFLLTTEQFKSILCFFKFHEKPKFDNDMLSKLRMIMDHLNKVMVKLITPDKKN